MTTRNPRTLAVAFALAATAVAAPTDAGSAREMRTAVIADGGIVVLRADQFPERRLWATLLAGLLGVVTIARRRMS